MLFSIIILIVSLTTLWWGAELLVDNASKLAKCFALSPAFIGINVGLITSFPELTVSIIALNNQTPDLVIGNVIGSNIANTALIIGFCAFLAPISFSKSSIRLTFFIIILSLLVTFLGYMNFSLGFFDGILLLVLLIAFLFSLYLGFVKSKGVKEKVSSKDGFKSIVLIIAGTIILIFSSKFIITSATAIAMSLGVSTFIIGLSIVAIGTSLPELITSVVALKNGHSEICIGNVLGSNIYNILLVLGVSSLIAPLPIKVSYIGNEFVWLIGIAILCSIFFFINRHKQVLTRRYGIIFLLLYALFIYSVICSGL